jgi:phosphatidylserine/phosphatidylglycerophosphate/cardiolipin synthase-like enzyme
MTVRVAVPIKIARLRAWVEKGRNWNAVDRLMLWALSERPRTAQALAVEAKIPSRLVNEIVLKLMRAGWVELSATPTGVAFRATETGASVVKDLDTLPALSRQVSRRLSFVIEPFALQAFSLREIKPYRAGEIESIARDNDVRRIQLSDSWRKLTTLLIHDAADKMLADVAVDEELSSIDFNGSTFPDGYALFPVIGDEIKGLPEGVPREMKAAIRRAAIDKTRGTTIVAQPIYIAPQSGSVISCPTIESSDIALSGEDHREVLVRILRAARYDIILHSTFLSSKAFTGLQDEFRAAAKRGAKIEMFWGAARDEQTTGRTLKEAIEINQICQADPELRGRAKAHMWSSRSHAKLLVADIGRPDRYVAVVGSCNWLSTRFSRVETSVVLRHPQAVAQVAQEFAELIFSVTPASEVAGQLNKIARELRKTSDLGEARVRIVTGDLHGELIRHARDHAARRIVVAGDRLGIAAEAKTLIPLISAASRNVAGLICYSRRSGPVSKADLEVLAREADDAHVRMLEIPDRELHGKFLLWDDDDIVISSLNWSSADTSVHSPQAEVGVHLSSPGVAAAVEQRLARMWPMIKGIQ